VRFARRSAGRRRIAVSSAMLLVAFPEKLAELAPILASR